MQEKMKRYTISYYFNGKKWLSEVYANSFEEAQEKLKAMSQGSVDGEIHLSIYVPVKEKSWCARLITRLLQKLS